MSTSTSSPAKAGSASGLYLSGHLSSGIAGPSRVAPPPRKKRRTIPKSIWNSTDDWDELIASSGLSTSSVSTRAPRPRGLMSLVKCSGDAAAKGFKRLWESTSPFGLGVGESSGRGWTEEWEPTPIHLRGAVRDGVWRWWGGVVSLHMLKHFTETPEIILPGSLLPCIENATSLSPNLLLPPNVAQEITMLKLQHAPKLSDKSLAGLIAALPNLEIINLKGCLLAGQMTVAAILQHCPKVKRINLKGTSVTQDDLQLLLDEFGAKLEGIKVDQVVFASSPDSTFSAGPFPLLTHLCLPGNLVNLANRNLYASAKAKGISHALPSNPAIRLAPPDALMDWHKLHHIFPSLTHLSLPGLLVPPTSQISLTTSTLVKLHIGAGGPPVPVDPIAALIQDQAGSLRSIRIGHITPGSERGNFDALSAALGRCSKVEEFAWEADAQGSKDMRCDRAMKAYGAEVCGEVIPRWSGSLRNLVLRLPSRLEVDTLHPLDEGATVADGETRPLEHLDISGMSISDTQELARAVSQYRGLRSLDLSGTNITDEDVFNILDHCPLISKIDLTSCRGVSVKYRRTIFAAWEAARRPPGEDDAPRKRARRR